MANEKTKSGGRRTAQLSAQLPGLYLIITLISCMQCLDSRESTAHHVPPFSAVSWPGGLTFPAGNVRKILRQLPLAVLAFGLINYHIPLPSTVCVVSLSLCQTQTQTQTQTETRTENRKT